MGVGRWLTPRPGRLNPGKVTRYQYEALSGAQGRYGRERKISLAPEFDPWIASPYRFAVPTTLSGPTASFVICRKYVLTIMYSHMLRSRSGRTKLTWTKKRAQNFRVFFYEATIGYRYCFPGRKVSRKQVIVECVWHLDANAKSSF